MILELGAQRGNLFSHLYQSIWWRASVSCAPCVYIFVQQTDACPILVRYSSECLARLVATLIYLLSIPFDPPWHRVPRARKIAQAGFHISVYRYTAIRRPISKSVCVPAVCVKRAFPRVCAHLRHVGSLFVPRAERPAVSAGLVLFVSLHPSPTRRDLTTTTTIAPLPRLHASIASMRVSIDALRACRE